MWCRLRLFGDTYNDKRITQVVAKYGLEKSQAQRDVDALMKGRQI
jgi:hypothetical protein